MPKTRADLLRDDATAVDRVVADFTRSESIFDAATGTLYQAVCPLRPLGARQPAEIRTWLELLGGRKLLDLIATVTELARPTSRAGYPADPAESCG